MATTVAVLSTKHLQSQPWYSLYSLIGFDSGAKIQNNASENEVGIILQISFDSFTLAIKLIPNDASYENSYLDLLNLYQHVVNEIFAKQKNQLSLDKI